MDEYKKAVLESFRMMEGYEKIDLNTLDSVNRKLKIILADNTSAEQVKSLLERFVEAIDQYCEETK